MTSKLIPLMPFGIWPQQVWVLTTPVGVSMGHGEGTSTYSGLAGPSDWGAPASHYPAFTSEEQALSFIAEQKLRNTKPVLLALRHASFPYAM
jgi:hypothetical protein